MKLVGAGVKPSGTKRSPFSLSIFLYIVHFWWKGVIGDFRQSRRQRLRNAEAAERSLQGEIAREIRRRWRVAYMGDLRQARRDEEMRMR